MVYSYKDMSHTYIHVTFLHTGVKLLQTDVTILHNEVTSLQTNKRFLNIYMSHSDKHSLYYYIET